ncbi:M4 family metallopeptidase [Kitasatospora sp. NPDC057015]|uniref:M4 family metallopeptidase n=1 Tax=Kitasatospora sp. NPDC057015 TaxID=3346001 RepID=UPI0036420FB9
MQQSSRTATSAHALIAAIAVVAVTMPAGIATASPSGNGDPTAAAGSPAGPRSGALPAPLTPAQQQSLVADAQSKADATASALKLGPQERLVVKSVIKNADGTVHTRYDRTLAGLPVLGGDLIVHQNSAGVTTGVDRATAAELVVPTTAAATSTDSAMSYALGRAREAGGAAPAATGVPRKVVWAAGGTPVLAWESVIGGVQDDGTPNELHVVTDAATGETLSEYQGIHAGTGHSQYSGQVSIGTTKSGTTYSMTDSGHGGHKTYDANHADIESGTLFTDADDDWGDGTTGSIATAAVDAAYGAQTTWDFYKNVLGRNGIRGDGVAANSVVHHGDQYINAHWSGACFCAVYGDGRDNKHPLTQLDVAGHEMSHGLTAATAGLQYAGETGGLNEATSDIFGTGVEFYANNAADPGDYLVNDRIDLNGDGTPDRYMDRPSRDGDSADYWRAGLGNLDVHYSSGPANHFFYLLSEGSGAKTVNGVNYDSPTIDGVAVPGIGRENALKLWYKALTERFTSTTDYKAARTQSLLAAADLWGAGSATYKTVAAAWTAVGVSPVTVTNPGNRSSKVNTAVSLQIQANAGGAGTLSYSASGLPAGLTINAATGLITGTPTATGTSNVTVTATAGTTTGSTTFTWTVTAALDGTHTLTASGKALDNPNHSTTPGTQLITYTPGTGTNQKWVLTQQTDGTYRIANAESGLCMDVNGGSTTAGTAIIQWTCTTGTNQRWTVTPATSGGYKIASKSSGLLLTTASTTNGALVTQQADTDTALQRWTIN